jgi:phosphate starvation-inducible PhoH-like protein
VPGALVGDVYRTTMCAFVRDPATGSLESPVSPTQVKIRVPGNHLMVGLLGQRDELLRLIQDSFEGSRIVVRGNEITIEGEDAERVGRLFDELVLLLEQGHRLDPSDFERTIAMVKDDVRPSDVLTSELLRSARGRSVHPKTAGQKVYTDAIASNVVTFGIGPAGTGKSYLAVALAVQALQAHQADRIILTRPAVEAGERLGFLPGDIMAKVDPYLRPLYDALYDLLGPEGAQRLLERGTIEVAPLAFMRGRTLNRSFIILDEAQNTSPEQMKMFLTRIGFGSKAVVTGDVTQVDVPGGRSGLFGLETILGAVDGLAFVHLGQRDVVRHRIVADIVAAYERADVEKAAGEAVKRGSSDADPDAVDKVPADASADAATPDVAAPDGGSSNGR